MLPVLEHQIANKNKFFVLMNSPFRHSYLHPFLSPMYSNTVSNVFLMEDMRSSVSHSEPSAVTAEAANSNENKTGVMGSSGDASVHNIERPRAVSFSNSVKQTLKLTTIRGNDEAVRSHQSRVARVSIGDWKVSRGGYIS